MTKPHPVRRLRRAAMLMAAGAAVGYLLDPDQGPARRQRLLGALTGAAEEIRGTVDRVQSEVPHGSDGSDDPASSPAVREAATAAVGDDGRSDRDPDPFTTGS